jgi:hypothetical protein
MAEKDQDTKEEKVFSGRVLVRMPASLHRELVEAAQADRVSLNQYVCALLAGGTGWRQSADGRGASVDDPGRDRVSDEEWYEIFQRTFF